MARGKLSFRVKALTIACSDLKRSRHFYQKVLGAETVKTLDGIGCPWFRIGSFEFTLVANATAPSPAEFPTHAMPILRLEASDLESAARRFARAGVEIIQPSDGRFMMITDPDGLVIEVWQAETDQD